MLTEPQKRLLQIHQDQNIAMLCMDGDYPLLKVEQQGEMLMCRYQSDEQWCHFSYNSSPQFIDSYLKENRGGQYLVISDPAVFEYIQQNHRIAWSIGCLRLFQDRVSPYLENGLAEPLQIEHLPVVFANSKYQQFLSLAYLTKRFELGGGFCIKEKGNPVAWIMTHDDGSVGMLHVLDDYRRKGYAKILIQAMAGKVREKNCPVFAHIEPTNSSSLNLFKSLGFEEKASVNWFKVR